jgi:hypothetical protein
LDSFWRKGYKKRKTLKKPGNGKRVFSGVKKINPDNFRTDLGQKAVKMFWNSLPGCCCKDVTGFLPDFF